jgi:calpain-15
MIDSVLMTSFLVNLVKAMVLLWVLLVEKALAKLHDSYKALQNESIKDLLTDLTGTPCKQLTVYGAHLRPKVSPFDSEYLIITHPLSTQLANDTLWSELLSNVEQSHLMTADVSGDLDLPFSKHAAANLYPNVTS